MRRAFILSEQLLTIALQAGFILVLYMSFYGLTSFYAGSQQVLAARNHAESVISFMDNRVRNAGLGLWRCKDSDAIAGKLSINMLKRDGTPTRYYRLPVSLKWNNNNMNDISGNDRPLESSNQNAGDVLTLLYAQRDLSTGTDEIVSAFKNPCTLTAGTPAADGTATLSGNILLLDNSGMSSNREKFRTQSLFSFGVASNIASYAVMEGLGLPMHLVKAPTSTTTGVDVKIFKVNVTSTESKDIIVPAGGDLMGLVAMQMFVHNRVTGEGGQFAYRTLKTDGTGWGSTYNQEAGILDIYMSLDTTNNTLTLWVLGTGGYDVKATNPRPESWPKEATPSGNTDSAAKDAWLASDYCHHTVYVSRATWKLNNIPPNFTW